MITWLGYAQHMREMRVIYTDLVEKPEGKKVLEIHRHRSKDNIKMDLKTGWACFMLRIRTRGRCL
jgi:hypothetical protein